jgi:hydroxymethylpyrimidine/phosphomethylpyrimidine kinase
MAAGEVRVADVPVVLVIAGSDSGGGAGIQADAWAIRDHGALATTAITAVTAQHTRGVTRVAALAPEMVLAQADAVREDMDVRAIKIGMLANAAIARAVGGWLAAWADRPPVVLDPVMVATSGDRLLDEDAIAAVRSMVPYAAVVTPNLPEADVLAGGGAAEAWAASAPVPVLLTGGDADGDVVVDRLVRPGLAPRVWEAPRIAGGPFHGTGCTLASAVAARLARGEPLEDAVDGAIRYVRARLAASLRPGRGSAVGGLLGAPFGGG